MSSTGEVFGATAVSVAESPWIDNAWTTPENALLDDGATANVTAATFDSGDQTTVLKVSGYDFSSIPDDAVIQGVVAHVNSWFRSGTGSASLDLAQLLNTSLAKVGDNKAAGLIPLTTTDTTVIDLGSPVDVWGNALDPAWIKDPNFGIALGIRATAANSDVDIDYVSLEVFWDAPIEIPVLPGVSGVL